MSMISEQVSRLKYLADDVDFAEFDKNLASELRKAADTIESLSTKLRAANMERSAEVCGGWIPCKERLPEEEGMYLITSKLLDETEVQYVFFQKNMDLFICNGIPTAWKPLPEPYHEP